MWGTLFKQANRLAQEGYNRKEVQEILRRAAELQAQAEQKEQQAEQKEQAKQSQIHRDALIAGAMAAGIQPEFLKQALKEFHSRQQVRPQEKQRRNWGKLAIWILAGIFGLPIALFALGTAAVALGITFSVLLVVGLALGVAGLVMLLMSPVVGVGFLVGLAAVIGHMIGRVRGQGRWRKQRWHRREDDDDD